ncbi:MAG: Asp-tRNA(Asn)/Glu-tRNA(Gln) amidotransferase subunit GatB [Proteobacteria bacterium]|nr:Asp-tRNA(Asn)/Glu-tRNA(Gln) amidotransferase subunit GatB [Pseudomonadota bacterium]MBI3499669.1 Asp-tRNA(Asn)/Glu-tRNA(Gln) amidotransferase subunit GatB [Pseudomonadota bacterium]
MSLFKGETGEWEVVIGLEVHAQVISKSKLFSAAATEFGAEPNTQVSFVDAAFPGMLPVINRTCIEQAVKSGLGINGEVNEISVFDRKNYFYADLPPGYQISQYSRPIVSGGHLLLDMPDGSPRRIGITRLHLEQDAGKSLHDQHPSLSYIDLNRAGVALMEIVSEPDLRTAEEAGLYIKKLRSILRYLGTCDGNMEEGSLRCDCNVSVRRPGAALGTRTETKNVNSVRYVMQAIEYETRRQVEVLESGGAIKQETRLFDPGKGETRPMRSKEHAHDYRYFPDPDLLPLELDRGWIEAMRRSLPELPDEKKARFVRQYGLTDYAASVLVAEREQADYYEQNNRPILKAVGGMSLDVDKVFRSGSDYTVINDVPNKDWVISTSTATANVVTSEIFGLMNRKAIPITHETIQRLDIIGLEKLKYDGTISGRIAKEVFEAMVETGKPASAIVEEKGLQQVSDTGALEAAVADVMAKNADKVAEYRSGKEKLFGFFVGQVMKATGGKANPGVVNQILKAKLAG